MFVATMSREQSRNVQKWSGEKKIINIPRNCATTTLYNLTLLFSLQGTNVVTFTVYWVFSALYLFVDFTGRPKWALQYKIQDGSNQPVSLSCYCLW